MVDAFTELPIVGLQNREQVINVLEEHIRDFADHIGEWPGPYDPLNSTKYIVWERRCCIWLGRVSERLKVCRELGVLPAEQAERLRIRTLAIINQAMSKMVAGIRR
jgi:hypothetical protein